MGALATATRTRHDHHIRLIRARASTDGLFQLLRDDAFYERPIAERHRVIFYLGHVEAFDWNLLGGRAFGLKRFHRSFDQLFAFGVYSKVQSLEGPCSQERRSPFSANTTSSIVKYLSNRMIAKPTLRVTR